MSRSQCRVKKAKAQIVQRHKLFCPAFKRQPLAHRNDTRITAQFIFEQFERFSGGLKNLTVVVMDNAQIDRARIIKERIKVWQRRGLYLFYLPRYSPHLNIVETMWRKLKDEWLAPKDYETRETLCYAVRQALSAIGTTLHINFSGFNRSLL